MDNQPNRVRYAYNYNRLGYDGRPLEEGTAVAPHLTVKSYLEAVHAKFDDADFEAIGQSIPQARLDSRLRELTQSDAEYLVHPTASAFYDDQGVPTLALTALFMDYIGEITILPAVKDALFTRVTDLEALCRAEDQADEDEVDFNSSAHAYK